MTIRHHSLAWRWVQDTPDYHICGVSSPPRCSVIVSYERLCNHLPTLQVCRHQKPLSIITTKFTFHRGIHLHVVL